MLLLFVDWAPAGPINRALIWVLAQGDWAKLHLAKRSLTSHFTTWSPKTVSFDEHAVFRAINAFHAQQLVALLGQIARNALQGQGIIQDDFQDLALGHLLQRGQGVHVRVWADQPAHIQGFGDSDRIRHSSSFSRK